MTAPNAELAYRVLDHVIAHPDVHDQTRWWCGTKGCFAGWTVVLAGGKLGDLVDEQYTFTGVVDGLPELIGKHVAFAAASLLGIADSLPHPSDAVNLELFDTHHTTTDLGRLVAEVFGPRPGATS